MTKIKTILFAAGALLAAGAVSAPAIAGDQPAAAPAPADASTSRVGTPEAGKGQIVFFRPSAAGMLLSFTVHEGDKGMVKLGNATYQVLSADPGAHTYMIESEARDTLTLEVEAGETYYVKQTMAMGLIVGHPRLNLSDQDSFDKIKYLKLSKLKPTDKNAGGAKTDAKTDTAEPK
ncbi:MAG TPA: DUF2846 domain-containing protein [Caulobacteraceae bacterium]|jgi:hypothetical protein|nr:DUF2846 domain-containing protein [Caulobacteraceae bacterium]